MADILIVEDEPALATLLSYNLTSAGHKAHVAGSAVQAMEILAGHNIDIALLDWMLPGETGYSLCQRLKSDPLYKDIKIIMLTARGAENDKRLCFEAGADDYLVKPFSLMELKARVSARLRDRPAQKPPNAKPTDAKPTDAKPTGAKPKRAETQAQDSQLIIDKNLQRATWQGHDLTLSPLEFRLLRFLATHPRQSFDRKQLLTHVWGGHIHVEARTVDVHIRRLRGAFDKVNLGQPLKTVRGIGYAYDPD